MMSQSKTLEQALQPFGCTPLTMETHCFVAALCHETPHHAYTWALNTRTKSWDRDRSNHGL